MKTPVLITADLTQENAQALAQFIKTVSHDAIRQCVADDAQTFLVRATPSTRCAKRWTWSASTRNKRCTLSLGRPKSQILEVF